MSSVLVVEALQAVTQIRDRSTGAYHDSTLETYSLLDCLSKRERTSLGERYVLDAQEVQRIGDAMMHALRALQGLHT